jgi:transposase
VGGDKLFVDYAGDTVPVIVDRLAAEVRQAQIFVVVLAASNLTYAEATWTRFLPNGSARTRTFAAIGCLLRLVVPDKSRRSTEPRWDGGVLRHRPCCRGYDG